MTLPIAAEIDAWLGFQRQLGRPIWLFAIDIRLRSEGIPLKDQQHHHRGRWHADANQKHKPRVLGKHCRVCASGHKELS